MVRAGSLRERIAIERLTDTGDDEFGNPSAAWGEVAQLWANIRETPGRERVAAGRLEAPVTATIRVRKSSISSAITSADRITARGAVWVAIGEPIDPTGTGELLEFVVERGGVDQ